MALGLGVEGWQPFPQHYEVPAWGLCGHPRAEQDQAGGFGPAAGSQPCEVLPSIEGLEERARPTWEQKQLLQVEAVVLAAALLMLVFVPVVVVACAKYACSCGLRYSYSMSLFNLADLLLPRFWR